MSALLGRAALAVLAFALCAQATAKEIVIGQVAPFSGPLAPTGRDISVGMQTYIASVNARGGVNGNTIKLVTRDDGYKVEETVRLTRELLAKEPLLALAGIVGTGNNEALLKQKVLEDAGIALVGVRSGASSLHVPFNPWIFHLRASYHDEVGKVVDTVARLGYERLATFYQDDPFGADGLAGVENALKRNKLSMVAKAGYPKNTTDVDKAVEVIAKADPQAVIMIANTAASAAFLKKLRAAGSHAQLYCVSVTDAEQLVKAVGEDAARGFVLAQVMPNPTRGYVPLVKEFLSALDRYGPDGAKPSYTALEGYIYGKVLVEGLRRAGPNPTRSGLIQALSSISAWDMGGYVVDFGPNRRGGSQYVELTVIGKGGKVLQ
jgi:ABC-type branched-subunit amino acid transport system substrate-binding protein